MRVVGPRKSKKRQKARNSPGGVRTHGIRITQMCVIQVTFANYIRTARYHCATGLKRPWTEDLGIFWIRKSIYRDVNRLSKILGG
jgi:hypothetical protein